MLLLPFSAFLLLDLLVFLAETKLFSPLIHTHNFRLLEHFSPEPTHLSIVFMVRHACKQELCYVHDARKWREKSLMEFMDFYQKKKIQQQI